MPGVLAAVREDQSTVSPGRRPRALIDSRVLRHERVWAAAGTPHAVFRAGPSILQGLTGARVTSVAG